MEDLHAGTCPADDKAVHICADIEGDGITTAGGNVCGVAGTGYLVGVPVGRHAPIAAQRIRPINDRRMRNSVHGKYYKQQSNKWGFEQH